MILEALGLYSIYRWFTHHCDEPSQRDSAGRISPNKHVSLPLTTFYKSEVTATVWSPNYDIDVYVVDAENLVLFRRGEAYSVCGETETKDGGQFHKIKATLEPGTHHLLLINWNQSTAAKYWHRIAWNPI